MAPKMMCTKLFLLSIVAKCGGSTLRLAGESSTIRMNGASLTASCQDMQSSVRLFSPLAFSSFDDNHNVVATLDGVAESCAATTSIYQPCANASDYPALFQCHWQSEGSVDHIVADRFAVATEEFSSSKRYLATRISLSCPIPPYVWLSAQNHPLKTNLVIKYINTTLPFRGIDGIITFHITSPTPPPPPPPPPPCLPPRRPTATAAASPAARRASIAPATSAATRRASITPAAYPPADHTSGQPVFLVRRDPRQALRCAGRHTCELPSWRRLVPSSRL